MDTREKLIELIGSTKYGNGSLIGNNFQKGFIEKIADHLIANGVTVQEWISVKDRLPDKKQTVLAIRKDGTMFIGYYMAYLDTGCWHIWTARNSTKQITQIVTHWQPLSEPPKGE